MGREIFQKMSLRYDAGIVSPDFAHVIGDAERFRHRSFRIVSIHQCHELHIANVIVDSPGRQRCVKVRLSGLDIVALHKIQCPDMA